MSNRLTVFYNDSCPICSREVAGYRRMTDRGGADVVYSGLSDGDHARFGLSDEEAALRFHVLKDGRLLSGVPAFAALWDEVPRLRWLSRLVRVRGLRRIADALYDHVLAPALYALHRRRQRRAESVSGRSAKG